MGGEGISDYEKQRLARISDNKARLEALGLPHLASAALGSFSKQQPKPRNLKRSKGRRSGRGGGGEDEEEYQPSESNGDSLEEEGNKGDSSSASEEEEVDSWASTRLRRKMLLRSIYSPEIAALIEFLDDDVELIKEYLLLEETSSRPSRIKGKKRSSSISAKAKKRSVANTGLNESDTLDDKAALMQAVDLSLKATKCDSAGTLAGRTYSTSNVCSGDAQTKKYKGKTQDSAAGRQKAIKLNKARVQLSEDEVVAYFFSFDETGKGYITPRDVKKMVSSHDFSWTDAEIEQMIHCFDNDGDRKLSLEDFRSIVIRCRMLQGTE